MASEDVQSGDPLRDLDLRDPGAVEDALRRGAEANRSAACRQGAIDVVEAPGRLIATGDIHDNPLHLARVVRAAGLDPQEPAAGGRAHLTLHELIHSDTLMNGMDFSHRGLARVAALKATHPEFVHTLLANHELAQVAGMGIVKNGVRVVDAFNEGLEFAFGDEAPRVDEAIREFVRSMPLALRCRTPRGDILCAHSIPGTPAMSRFDPSVLSRELTEADYEPRTGSAHLMVWGRHYDHDQVEDLVERWGVSLFILGHEHAETGVEYRPPAVVVLNSDHERGVYLPIDLSDPPGAQEAVGMVVPLRSAT